MSCYQTEHRGAGADGRGNCSFGRECSLIINQTAQGLWLRPDEEDRYIIDTSGTECEYALF